MIKKLLVLGGNRISMEIVNAAKKKGIYTIVTDWNAKEDSPAKQIADECYQISITDMEQLTKLVLDREIDGIITGFADSYLPFYACLCEKTGRPCYGTEEVFRWFENKENYLSCCGEFGIPTVEKYSFEEVENMKFPVILKPVDNSGARGIEICREPGELRHCYEEAIKYSSCQKVLIEHYVEKREEATVFFLFIDGEVYLTGIGDRHIGKPQDGVIGLPVGYSFPSKYVDLIESQVKEKLCCMFKSIGLKNGMLFIQGLIENGVWYPYDMGYRLTGSLEYKLMEKVAGFNPLDMLIDFAVTGHMESSYSLKPKYDAHWTNRAYNLSVLAKPGRIHKIEGVESIGKMPGVIEAVLAHNEGDTIEDKAVGTLSQIILRVLYVADTEENANQLVENIRAIFKVYDCDEKDMLL